jgi:hypothetical protein
MKILNSFVLVFFSVSCLAQLKITSIYRDPVINPNNKAARKAILPPLPLPFWDDFSFNRSKYYPNDTLWQNSQTVWVNSGTGINPPSINVATFDGYDSLGKPHRANLAEKGIADSLISRRLKMGDLLNPMGELKTEVPIFISFFYQSTGNGEAPDEGDVLSLLFKDKTGKWNEVWNSSETANLDPTKFIEKVLPITDLIYFHNDFQFRFQNSGRLSGPYDTWNLDYIYINNGKRQYTTENITSPTLGFPDRTLVYPLTSPIGRYTSVPVKQFFSNPTKKLDSLVLSLTNRRGDLEQPVAYRNEATISSKNHGTTTVLLDNGSANANPVKFNSILNRIVKIMPNLSAFINEEDSLSITFDILLDTKDNVEKRPIKDNEGDFDTLVFKGIDFRHNDRIKSTFLMQDYYAYDDGVAEYGALLTGAGVQLAYQFDLLTSEPQTVTAIDLYLPKFGDTSPQTIQLFVLNALTGSESDYLTRLTYSIKRDSLNTFRRIPLGVSVTVKDKFYIGWRINSEVEIAVGLDKNTDSGDKIFVNTAGTWQQNTKIKGSLLLRPVFGEPIISGIDEYTMPATVYPIPTRGVFYLPTSAEQIQLFNVTGQEVKFEVNKLFDKKEIAIQSPSPGLFLVRYFDKVWRAGKITVRF